MSAKVSIGVDDAGLQAGLSRATASVKTFATKSQAAGATAGAAISKAFAFAGGVAAVRGFITEMGRVNDLAQRFGVTAESIQRVGNVAQLAGSDIEQVAKVMSKLTVEAAKGNETFAALGISAAAFAGADLDQQVVMLARAYEMANGDQTKMVQLMELLGTRGQDILPLLADGADNVAAAMANMAVVTEGSVKSMARMDDQIDVFFQNAKMAFGVLIQEVRVFGAALDSLSMSGFDADKFQKLSEEITNPKKADKKRSPFDPDAFNADKGGAKNDAEKAAKKQAEQIRNTQDLMADLEIARAKRLGHNRKAGKLEEEKNIDSETRRIMESTGVDEATAAALATEKVTGKRARGRKAGTVFDQGFNAFFHGEETQFGQRSGKGFGDQSFNEFFHGKDPQRQTAEARAERAAQNSKATKDPFEVLKAQLTALEKLAAY